MDDVKNIMGVLPSKYSKFIEKI